MENFLRNLTFGKSWLISLVLVVVYYFGFFDDGSMIEAQIASIQVEYNKLDTERNSIKAILKDAERYKETRAALGAEVDRVARAIPIDLTPNDFLRRVSNEAKNVGVQINSVSTSGIKAGDDVVEGLEVSVSLAGEYNEIMAFMSNLTKLDIMVSTKSVSMTATRTGKDNKPKIAFQATLVAHRLKKPPEEKK